MHLNRTTTNQIEEANLDLKSACTANVGNSLMEIGRENLELPAQEIAISRSGLISLSLAPSLPFYDPRSKRQRLQVFAFRERDRSIRTFTSHQSEGEIVPLTELSGGKEVLYCQVGRDPFARKKGVELMIFDLERKAYERFGIAPNLVRYMRNNTEVAYLPRSKQLLVYTRQDRTLTLFDTTSVHKGKDFRPVARYSFQIDPNLISNEKVLELVPFESESGFASLLMDEYYHDNGEISVFRSEGERAWLPWGGKQFKLVRYPVVLEGEKRITTLTTLPYTDGESDGLVIGREDGSVEFLRLRWREEGREPVVESVGGVELEGSIAQLSYEESLDTLLVLQNCHKPGERRNQFVTTMIIKDGAPVKESVRSHHFRGDPEPEITNALKRGYFKFDPVMMAIFPKAWRDYSIYHGIQKIALHPQGHLVALCSAPGDRGVMKVYSGLGL